MGLNCGQYDSLFELLSSGLTYPVWDAANKINADPADLQAGLKRIKKVTPFLIVWDEDDPDGNVRIPQSAKRQVEDMLRGSDEDGKKGFCNLYLTPEHERIKKEKEDEARRKALEEKMWRTTVYTSRFAAIISVLSAIIALLSLLK